ncbi:MAG: polysulfide reductase [Actinobacteria bacterium]|nr:MAG: polysulfide reductase [Actinomycetota bacterium]
MTDSYYGRPVIKAPVWTPEIPAYFFSGGLGGASAGLAYVAERRGNDVLARRAWAVALGGLSASPALLISDLGVPSRFLNMLRMFKVTSPMSVGSWLLSVSGTATGFAAANALTGLFPATSAIAKPAAALFGLPLSTYTGALIANTSVPVWHEARLELPALFAGGAAASAGAAATVLTPTEHAAPARRLALIGAAAELVTTNVMEHRLGKLAEPYHEGPSAALARGAKVLTALGGMVLAGWGHRRSAAIAGGAAILAGGAAERFAVFKAGFESANDPKYTVAPQRERLAARQP